MSRRAFGTVRRLPSGRWQARYRDLNGKLVSAPGTFPRRTDAERWLATVDADLHRGNFIDPRAGQLTVGVWSQRWLSAASGHLKIKTVAGYQSLLQSKIVPRFGKVPLAAVKPIMVNEWVADLRAQGLSPSRVRQSYRLLSQIMQAAVENDLITITPCRGVRLPRMPQTEPHIISPQQAERIVAAARPPHDALILLLAYAGLRIGEGFALRRRDIDLEAGAINVTQEVVEIAGHLSFDTPKSHQKRMVLLPGFVIERLRLLLNTLDRSPDTLLFATSRGGPQHYNGWRKSYFDPAVRAADLTDLTPHDLRASHATWVAETHGVMAAAARLGHAHASVTTRHYARTSVGQDRSVADQLDRDRDDPAPQV